MIFSQDSKFKSYEIFFASYFTFYHAYIIHFSKKRGNGQMDDKVESNYDINEYPNDPDEGVPSDDKCERMLEVIINEC